MIQNIRARRAEEHKARLRGKERKALPNSAESAGEANQETTEVAESTSSLFKAEDQVGLFMERPDRGATKHAKALLGRCRWTQAHGHASRETRGDWPGARTGPKGRSKARDPSQELVGCPWRRKRRPPCAVSHTARREWSAGRHHEVFARGYTATTAGSTELTQRWGGPGSANPVTGRTCGRNYWRAVSDGRWGLADVAAEWDVASLAADLAVALATGLAVTFAVALAADLAVTLPIGLAADLAATSTVDLVVDLAVTSAADFVADLAAGLVCDITAAGLEDRAFLDTTRGEAGRARLVPLVAGGDDGALETWAAAVGAAVSTAVGGAGGLSSSYSTSWLTGTGAGVGEGCPSAAGDAAESEVNPLVASEGSTSCDERGEEGDDRSSGRPSTSSPEASKVSEPMPATR
ncbi:hypothetical protein ON010_g6695 [Phytophthora cinnamomi]|nr:hypothetical protein ON010_g6695 [Phytophthora cinnamomi]